MKITLLFLLICFYSAPSFAQALLRHEKQYIPKGLGTYCLTNYATLVKKWNPKPNKHVKDILALQDQTVLTDLIKGANASLKRKGLKPDCDNQALDIAVYYMAWNESQYVPPQTIDIPIYQPGTTVSGPGYHVTTPSTVSHNPINLNGGFVNGVHLATFIEVVDAKNGAVLYQGRGDRMLTKITGSKIASTVTAALKYMGRK
jgi:hypothetical protein